MNVKRRIQNNRGLPSIRPPSKLTNNKRQRIVPARIALVVRLKKARNFLEEQLKRVDQLGRNAISSTDRQPSHNVSEWHKTMQGNR